VATDVEALYRKHAAMVYRRCRRLLADDAQAYDAMQDTFVELLKRQSFFTVESPPALLYRMATNVSLNRLRSQKRRRENFEDPRLASLLAIDAEETSVARSVLAALFASERTSTLEIAVMHWVDGMTHEEVARVVQMSVSGVRKRLARVQARLQALEGSTT
jgi:RNA polymerase sigma-70 factor (ECF subfamily)